MDILGMIKRPVVSVRVTLGRDDVRGLRLICHKPRESSPVGFAPWGLACVRRPKPAPYFWPLASIVVPSPSDIATCADDGRPDWLPACDGPRMTLPGGKVARVLPPDSASAMAVIVAAWSARAGALAAIKTIGKTASLIGAVRDTIVLHPPSPFG
jgi:hypothetical protein